MVSVLQQEGDMRKFSRITTMAAAAALACATMACEDTAEVPAEAASIVGSWEADPDSFEFNGDTDTYLIADGDFTCESCETPYTIPADGEWHKIDQPFADEQRIEVVDDRTIKGARRKDGKDIGGATWTVSEDGQSMAISWTDISGEEPTSGTANFVRAEDGPEGSHAASGSWNIAGLSNMSEEGGIGTYAIDGDTITATWNNGSYTAVIGGDPVSVEGDDTGMIAVKRTGENSFRETYTVNGEERGTLDITVDGDTLTYLNTNLRDGSTVRWTATRQ